MNSNNANGDVASKAILIAAIIVAIIGIAALFLKWLVLDTTYPVDLSVIGIGMTVPIPVDGYVTATGGSLPIPDDWHVFMPALTCILPAVGAILIVCSYFAPNLRKYTGFAVIVFGLAAVVCACIFYVWEFDAMLDLAKLYENPVLGPLLPPGIAGEIPIGIVTVKDNLSVGFFVAIAAGVLTAILGFVNTALHRN